ncbi:MAG: glycosyltransferase family 4 protein [Pseudomonadota bacterium]
MLDVLVVQRRMTHYRIPFFQALKKECAQRNMRLHVAYGGSTPEESIKNDESELDWGVRLPTRYFLKGKLCYQPFAKIAADKKLIVLTPENKLINNLATQFLNKKIRVVLWGHGANLQGNPKSFREKFKRIVAKKADWWLGYTQMSMSLITASGFPKNRITILNNSVDTTELRQMKYAVQPETLQDLQQNYEIKGECVGVFIGSLYGEKRIPFMLEAVKAIQKQLPHFEFLVIGSGPHKNLIEDFAQQHSWVKYFGPLKGQEKVNIVTMAHVMINPGLVGLGILDSFVCEVPMITTDCNLHSPEISYIAHGENGLMVKNTQSDYVNAVVELFNDQPMLMKLQKGCAESAQQYTVENMAKNFAEGLQQCLDTPFYR